MQTIQPHPATVSQPVTQLPSGLFVPRAPAVPAGAQETRPSGLVVVRNDVSPVTAGSKLVVADRPAGGASAVEAAKAAHAELAAARGTAAADILHGPQVELVERIRADEIRREAIAAFLAGDVHGAAAIIARAD